MCLDLAAALSTGMLRGGTGRWLGSRAGLGWDSQDRTASPGQQHLQDHCRHRITLGFQQRPQERGCPVGLFVGVQHGQCFCPAPCKHRLLRVVSFDGVLQFAAGCLLPKRRRNVFTAKKGKQRGFWLLRPSSIRCPQFACPGLQGERWGNPKVPERGCSGHPICAAWEWCPGTLGCPRAGAGGQAQSWAERSHRCSSISSAHGQRHGHDA